MPPFVRSASRPSTSGEYIAYLTPHLGFTFHRKPLSFHTVSFGPHNEVLRRMAQVARTVEAAAARDPLLSPDAHVESSYTAALTSVCSHRGIRVQRLTWSRFD